MLNEAADDSYFAHVRSEIEPLLPDGATRVLEIGCGSGATLLWLKKRWPEAQTTGVDGYPPIKSVLEKNVDVAIIADLEEEIPVDGRFDLILALDVLEHLRNPEAVLLRLAESLEEHGRVIVSLPNIAHISILRDLVLRRRFAYKDSGILDRTHLRFFTEESAVALLRGAGLHVEKGVVNGLDGTKASIANKISFGLLKHYFVKQYVLVAGRSPVPGNLSWKESRRPSVGK